MKNDRQHAGAIKTLHGQHEIDSEEMLDTIRSAFNSGFVAHLYELRFRVGQALADGKSIREFIDSELVHITKKAKG